MTDEAIVSSRELSAYGASPQMRVVDVGQLAGVASAALNNRMQSVRG